MNGYCFVGERFLVATRETDSYVVAGRSKCFDIGFGLDAVLIDTDDFVTIGSASFECRVERNDVVLCP